ncbi:uncharacterized protein LOC125498697 [Beta vulgaris subsp. vulgaris]|uniref:uncharacterized protein LOC125498697 n=1 Tax=Beta vulgaris subsp. vulgaris TaxID=3555 RepID=UPI00203666BF|nr:uncharacterized protein LOC125498697 [Beta vulgaris subsp. vulgaris]
MDNVQYATWAELFKVHCRSVKVLHHIIRPFKDTPISEPKIDAEKELWSTLDATVLGWIYSTISEDLLNTILEPDSTAMDTWNRLQDIFQDNKHSQAVTLEQEFSPTHMADFSSASSYCQRLKVLSDQLKNVGAPVSNNRLVLQMVAGLTVAYNNVGTLIHQSDPLPPFYKAWSMLILKEAGLTKQAATTGDTALVVTPYKDSDSSSFYSDSSNHHKNKPKNNNCNNTHKNKNHGGKGGGRGGGGGGRTSGGGHGGHGSSTVGQDQRQWQHASPWSSAPYGYPWQWGVVPHAHILPHGTCPLLSLQGPSSNSPAFLDQGLHKPILPQLLQLTSRLLCTLLDSLLLPHVVHGHRGHVSHDIFSRYTLFLF